MYWLLIYYSSLTESPINSRNINSNKGRNFQQVHLRNISKGPGLEKLAELSC